MDANIWTTESAFVQARWHDSIPILAADGSDVNIPRNSKYEGSSFQGGDGKKSYNLIHLNVFYDLNSGIYTDVIVQDKRKADERQVVIDMMEVSPF
ncbi:transposase [Streptococcus sp. 121]|uniref:transposase n=1 Tax=Streptococcus sp. 121 TaxID=2797637 RepID=UPI0018F0A13F|nr:transposase [Streptococcus sp. 121]MBJ6745744.1 transposase [Streptococcus sp. 121]